MANDSGYYKQLEGTPMETLQKNKPIYFENNLRSMVAIANEYDISVLLSTWAYTTEHNDYAATPHYQWGFEEHNQIIKKVASSHNTYFYDFRAQMPMDKQYWHDGRHLLEKGVELKAKLFATYIINNDKLRFEIEERIKGQEHSNLAP